eukprot:TRINITY_DN17159_c0_g1_i1.p1 TRINITY_DN17159_c0_g1~~TRINITY_DN17159_c0_g1_i1.p1  ORF type:complete len:634 (-),score=98.37 TRINITY_DN17159_c0_g1_i1:33-1934(-)
MAVPCSNFGICCFVLSLALASLVEATITIVKSENGRLDYTIHVQAGTWQVADTGISFTTRTYNGEIPGPQFEVKNGDFVRIVIKNDLGPNAPNSSCKDHVPGEFRLPNATNLHVHGIYDSALHDNTFLCIDSGATAVYEYLIDPRSKTATFWLHPHLDGNSAMQLYGGLASAFIIRNEEEDRLHGLSSLKEETFVLQYLWFSDTPSNINKYMVNPSGDATAAPPSTMPLNLVNPENFEGELLLANNQLGPKAGFTLGLGEQGILRLINALSGGANDLILAFTDKSSSQCVLDVLAYDGVYLKKARRQTKVFIPSGGRADLAVTCSVAGVHCIETVELVSPEFGKYGQQIPAGHKAVCIEVVLDSDSLPKPELTTLPGPPLFYADLTGDKIIPTGTGTQTFGDMSGGNVVDGVQFPNQPLVSATMKKGSIEEWRIFGGQGPSALANVHPWHMHNTHFQVVDISYDQDGLLAVPGDYRDTVPLYMAVNYTIRFVAPFENKVMVHCHILKHEDLGMMTLWQVENANATHAVEDDGSVVVGDGGHQPVAVASIAEYELAPSSNHEDPRFETFGHARPVGVSVQMLILCNVASASLAVIGYMTFQRTIRKHKVRYGHMNDEQDQETGNGNSDQSPTSE